MQVLSTGWKMRFIIIALLIGHAVSMTSSRTQLRKVNHLFSLEGKGNESARQNEEDHSDITKNLTIKRSKRQTETMSPSQEDEKPKPEDFIYERFISSSKPGQKLFPESCTDEERMQTKKTKLQKWEIEIHLDKVSAFACRSKFDKKDKPPQICPPDEDGNAFQCWDDPNADPDWQEKSSCRNVKEQCENNTTMEYFACYETAFNANLKYKKQFMLLNESQNWVRQMCEAKRNELNKEAQRILYPNYWHGFAFRFCVTKTTKKSDNSFVDREDAFLVVQGSVATSYSDEIIQLPTRSERIGTEEREMPFANGTKKPIKVFKPPLASFTCNFDGQRMSAKFRDSNGTTIYDSISQGRMQLHMGKSGLTEFGLHAVISDMGKMHFLQSNISNSCAFRVSINGENYTTTQLAVNETELIEREKEIEKQHERAKNESNIGCWKMREANALQKGNCKPIVVNYEDKCVPLYPGDDTLNDIEYATYKLDEARRKCGISTREKRQAQPFVLQGKSGHWDLPIHYAVEVSRQKESYENGKHCGGKLTADNNQQSIEFGERYGGSFGIPWPTLCYWRINTDQIHQRISITVQELWGFNTCDKNCNDEYLEVKLYRDKTAAGPRICCGNDLPFIFTTGKDTEVQLILRRSTPYQGFKLVYDTPDSQIVDEPPPKDYAKSHCTLYTDANECAATIHPEGEFNIIDGRKNNWSGRLFTCPVLDEYKSMRSCKWGYGYLTVNGKYRIPSVNGSAHIYMECYAKDDNRFWLWKRGINDEIRVDDIKCGTVTH